MNVTNGGLAHADVYVVVGSGSTSGALNVSGVNSAVTPGFSLYVGDGGTGVATFSQSCTATPASTIIGTTPGGNGTLNVQTGAQLTLGALTIGDTGNNATGVVNLTDSGSSISLGGSSTLVVGGAPASGAANLNVLVGSIFTGGTALSTINATGTVTVGAANGTAPTFNANGNITVNGGNFTVANTGVFNWAASKTLTVQSAGHFSFTSPSLYYYFPSNSTVLVTGTGSHLSTAWAFQVSSGSQMTVNAGASLSASATVDVGNSGTLTIDGPGTTAVIGSPVYQDDIGFSGGPGTVTASNGAVATLAGSVSVGNDTVPGNRRCDVGAKRGDAQHLQAVSGECRQRDHDGYGHGDRRRFTLECARRIGVPRAKRQPRGQGRPQRQLGRDIPGRHQPPQHFPSPPRSAAAPSTSMTRAC